MNKWRCSGYIGVSLAGLMSGSIPASAQVEEIVVTARKKQEASINVPVVISTLSSKDISRYNTNNFSALEGATPGLILDGANTSGAGGSIHLRGVGTGGGNPSSDQSISINIDGVPMSGGNILRAGFIDLKQIEVLKGPQTLFFGKNSPGGIISLTTEDPTSVYELSLRSSYEFKADEVDTQLVASGPIAAGILGRIAVGYMHSKGYFTNKFHNLSAAERLTPSGFTPESYQPLNARAPRGRDYFVRVTVKLIPSDNFTSRAKFTYFDRRNNLGNNGGQRIYCPNGGIATGDLTSPAAGALVDCRADGKLQSSWSPPYNAALLNAKFGTHFPANGSPFSSAKTLLASLENNYTVIQNIILTSVSGFVSSKDELLDEFSYTPLSFISGGQKTRKRDFTQELRLRMDSDGPVDLLAGAFFGDSYLRNVSTSSFTVFDTVFGPGAGIFPNRPSMHKRRTYSVFGQVSAHLTEQIELSGGARYTKERVRSRLIDEALPPALQEQRRRASFENLSPEITLSYQPSRNLNIFGSYRTGFKSGGFDASTGAPLAEFRPEKAKGGEVGIKARLFDRQLTINSSIYRYKYSDLQNSLFDTATTTVYVVNAGDARVQGFDMEVGWQPFREHALQLRGALNYNHARYTRFIADCFTGQSLGQGCNLALDPVTGRGTKQDLSGRQLLQAPDWTANAGFSYDRPLSGGGLSIGLASDVQFSSSYDTSLSKQPGTRVGRYAKINAAVRVYDERAGWEIALIGRNLTNKYTFANGYAVVDAGLAFLGGDPRTGTVDGARWDALGTVARGREVRLQLTLHPADLLQ